jgi:MFS family permease
MLLPSSLTFYTSRWMQLTLLGWMVLEKTDSALLVAMVGFALMAPLLVFGLVGGVVADSPRRMTVIRALQGFNLAAVVALGIVFAFDSVAAWTAYPVVITTGVAWAFDQPFKRRVVRDLLGVAGVTNGIALESVVMTASRLIGPAIAGLLIATVGVRLGYFAVVGLAVASYVLIWLVNIPPPSGVEKRTEGTKRLTSVFEGLSYVKSDRLLLGTVVVTIAVNLFIFPYLQVILVVARDVIEVEAGLGLLLSAEGLGSLAAAMTIASFAGRAGRLGVLYMVGSTVAAAGLLLLSFQTGYVGALLSLLLMGFGLAGFSTMQAAIVVVNSADQMRGKALGVVTLAIGAGPLGALIVGAVANSFGPQLALRIDALAALASLAALGILVPEFRARMGARRLGDSQAALVDPPSRATV